MSNETKYSFMVSSTRSTKSEDRSARDSTPTPNYAPTVPQHGNHRRGGFLNQFRPATQVPTAWLLCLSACAGFVLTAYYAFGTTLLVNSPLITSSPSRTILVIRVLSAVTELLLVGLVAACFERTKWMLAASKKGTPILDFVSLSEGTGVWGLLNIAFARVKNIGSSRCWTAVRGLVLLTVPALGVIILSDVKVVQTYTSNGAFPIAGGIGDFNASYADNSDIQLLSGLVMTRDIGSFLTNPKVSSAVSPVTSTESACINGGGGISGECVLSYYVSGGLDMISPWPALNYTLPESPIYTVWNNPGYQFDFSSADSSVMYDGPEDCNMYGEDNSLIRFCIATSGVSTINMRMVGCPIGTSGDECSQDTSWWSNAGLDFSFQAYRRTATVHYFRSNQTIAAVSDLSEPTRAAISPEDLFRVYNATFRAAGGVVTGVQLVGLLSNNLLFGTNVGSAQGTAKEQLRNLAVLPLYLYQPTYLGSALSSDQMSPNAPASGLPRELYTTASFSAPLFKLTVNKATLFAYVIAGGVLLTSCLLVLILGSLDVTAGGIEDNSPYSVLDIAIGCSDGGDADDLPRRLRELKGVTGNKLLEKLKDIRVYVPEDTGSGHGG